MLFVGFEMVFLKGKLGVAPDGAPWCKDGDWFKGRPAGTGKFGRDFGGDWF